MATPDIEFKTNQSESEDSEDDVIFVGCYVPGEEIIDLSETILETTVEPEIQEEGPPPCPYTKHIRCPICLGPPFENHASVTMCGHVFCNHCISMAVKQTHKCPICNQQLMCNQIHTIYIWRECFCICSFVVSIIKTLTQEKLSGLFLFVSN